jgi:branched-chain amino acid transport system substrate-binding protein
MKTLTFRTTSHRKVLATIAIAMAVSLTSCADDADEKPSGSSGSDDVDAAIAAAPEGTFAGEKAAGDPVKVGLLSSEGGLVDMTDSRMGAEAAVEYANANLGGLAGHEIDLQICKYHEEDPSSMTKCANELVQSDVVAVVSQATGLGAQVVPIITQAGLSYSSYSGNSPAEMGTPGSFLWTGGTPSIATTMAKVAAGDGVKKFTLYVIDTGEVTAQMQALSTPIFEAAGVELEVTAIPIGQPDTSPQVAAGLESDPDAVAIIGDANTCTSVLKGLETVGSDATKYLIQPCTDPAVGEAVPNAYEGSYLVTAGGATGSDDEGKAYRAIMAKYAPDAPTSGQAPSGYQSMLGFIRNVNAGISGDTITAETVKAAIANAKEVPLPLGAGIMMTCDGKQSPIVPASCSSQMLVGKFEGDSVPEFEIY